MTSSRGETTYIADSGAEFTAHESDSGGLRPVAKIGVVLLQSAKSLNHPLLLSTFAADVAQAIAFFAPEDRIDMTPAGIASIRFEVSFQG